MRMRKKYNVNRWINMYRSLLDNLASVSISIFIIILRLISICIKVNTIVQVKLYIKY
jgi:hypothetical protein